MKYLATVKIENGRTVADYADGTVVWRVKDEEERSYIYGSHDANEPLYKEDTALIDLINAFERGLKKEG